MKILYFKWNSFGTEDIQEAFERLGHELIVRPYLQDDLKINDELVGSIKKSIFEADPDALFSSNYYPPIAEAAHETGVKYISWVYDSPHVMLYSYTVIYDTNRIFVFDREQCEEFQKNRISTVSYLPLAANPERLMGLVSDERQQALFTDSRFFNRSDIAFVGAMYDEDHDFYKRLTGIGEYTRGYLEGLIAAQEQVWGCNFIKSFMREDIMEDMSKSLPMQAGKGSVATRDYLFAEYCINREITARERKGYIDAIGRRFSDKDRPALDLYTGNPDLKISGVCNHGPIDHYATAPFVYNRAGINLNITLRSIHSGIPLRAFEILASGGFLLSNYQADFADCYVDGVDYVSFESKEDMLDKIEYYLNHEKERKEIAKNGFKRTLENHTYLHRIEELTHGL